MEELYILNGTDTLDTWSIWDFSQKIFFAFFSSLFEYFFSLFFCDLFYVGLGLIPNITLTFTIFFYLLQYLRDSMGGISPSWIACEMIFAMLSNLLLAWSLLESCFSYFTVKVSKDFSVIAVPRERSKLVSLKAMLTGNSTPLANAAVSPVITVDLIKPVSTIPVITLNRFIFLAIRSRASIFSRKNPSIPDFVQAICLWFLWCCRVDFAFIVVYANLYLIDGDRMSLG